jgi:hypothetical protein
MCRAKSILCVCIIEERYQFSQYFRQQKVDTKNRYSLSVLELAYLCGAQLNCHVNKRNDYHCLTAPSALPTMSIS